MMRSASACGFLRWYGRCAIVLAAVSLAAGTSLALAQVLPPLPKYDYNPEFDDKPWEEQQSQLPPYPRQENLILVNIGPGGSFDFLVDAGSVSVGSDGVVRYTLVARSTSGAVNVSFEGIRCNTRERKLYGFGRPDGTWTRAKNSDWVQITRIQVNLHHVALADDYFCPKRVPVRDAEDAVRVLRLGGHPAARN